MWSERSQFAFVKDECFSENVNSLRLYQHDNVTSRIFFRISICKLCFLFDYLLLYFLRCCEIEMNIHMYITLQLIRKSDFSSAECYEASVQPNSFVRAVPPLQQ
jgi:hypothetical protein